MAHPIINTNDTIFEQRHAQCDAHLPYLCRAVGWQTDCLPNRIVVRKSFVARYAIFPPRSSKLSIRLAAYHNSHGDEIVGAVLNKKQADEGK